MTKLEWFDLQPKYIQDKIKDNCSVFNRTNNDFFDYWVNSKNNSGLMGAFAFSDTIEGWDFWYDIHVKMIKCSKFIKVC
jgi:hypothetical protein